MPTALELREKKAETWERAKEINDHAEAEDRDLSAEEKLHWDKAHQDMTELDERIARQEQLERTPADRSDRSLRDIERATAGPNDGRRLTATPEYREAFESYVRYGRIDMPAEQRAILQRGFLVHSEARALAVGSATAGGYLVPEEFVRAIEQAEAFFGGMREVATIIRTDSGADLPFPTSNDTANVGRILNENQAVTQTDPNVGIRVLKAFMYSSDEVLVPYQLLQDSAFSIDNWLRDLLAERIGRITNTHFTTGVGPNFPSGIVNDAVAGVTAAATGAVTWDELIDLEHTVNIAYRRRGPRYMLHDITLRELKQLKDGNGQYLWKQGAAGGDPNTINGYPYTINNDVAQMATGVRAILFGLLSKYIIRDVRGFTLLRLDERHAENLQVAFLGFSRHDGMLLDAGGGPVQALTMD